MPYERTLGSPPLPSPPAAAVPTEPAAPAASAAPKQGQRRPELSDLVWYFWDNASKPQAAIVTSFGIGLSPHITVFEHGEDPLPVTSVPMFFPGDNVPDRIQFCTWPAALLRQDARDDAEDPEDLLVRMATVEDWLTRLGVAGASR